jgi:hypothetical protein
MVVTDYRDIAQAEYEDSAEAKRVIIVDSTGTQISVTNPLPVEDSSVFSDNPSYAFTRNVNNLITSIDRTIGVSVTTMTITRDVNGYVTNISEWV